MTPSDVESPRCNDNIFKTSRNGCNGFVSIPTSLLVYNSDSVAGRWRAEAVPPARRPCTLGC